MKCRVMLIAAFFRRSRAKLTANIVSSHSGERTSLGTDDGEIGRGYAASKLRMAETTTFAPDGASESGNLFHH